MTAQPAAVIDEAKVQELEQEFDPEMRFRPTLPPASHLVKWLLIVLSCFHYYTAGFGLLRETTHRGIHLAFVLGLIFLVFAFSKAGRDRARTSSWAAPGGVPLVDWALAIAVALSVLYIPYVFEDLAFRVASSSAMTRTVPMTTSSVLGLPTRNARSSNT